MGTEQARRLKQLVADLDPQRVDPTRRLVFDDGYQLALTSNTRSMWEQLEAREPGSFEGLQRYLWKGEQHYQPVPGRSVNRICHSTSDHFSFQNLARIYRVKLLANHY